MITATSTLILYNQSRFSRFTPILGLSMLTLSELWADHFKMGSFFAEKIKNCKNDFNAETSSRMTLFLDEVSTLWTGVNPAYFEIRSGCIFFIDQRIFFYWSKFLLLIYDLFRKFLWENEIAVFLFFFIISTYDISFSVFIL